MLSQLQTGEGFPGFAGKIVPGRNHVMLAQEDVMLAGNCALVVARLTTRQFALVSKCGGELRDIASQRPKWAQLAIESSRFWPEIGPYNRSLGGYFVKVFTPLPLTGNIWEHHVFVPCNQYRKCRSDCRAWVQ